MSHLSLTAGEPSNLLHRPETLLNDLKGLGHSALLQLRLSPSIPASYPSQQQISTVHKTVQTAVSKRNLRTQMATGPIRYSFAVPINLTGGPVGSPTQAIRGTLHPTDAATDKHDVASHRWAPWRAAGSDHPPPSAGGNATTEFGHEGLDVEVPVSACARVQQPCAQVV